MTQNNVYIIDTNIILEDAKQIFNMGDNNLYVLPETVIDELDSKKTGFSEINFQAREFGRILSESTVVSTEYQDGKTTMTITVNGFNLQIISFDSYDLHNVDSSVINDRKIIEVAKFVSNDERYNSFDEIILLSNDIMCRTRALSSGVKSEGVLNNTDSEASFIKTIKTDFVVDNQLIREIDKEYLPENYCYVFKMHDGNERIGYVVNERVRLISDFAEMNVKPLNLGQRFAAAGMLDGDIDVTIINALAGSGKTLIAISAGMALVDADEYDKIVYIRNSVESVDKAEEVGFLPGLEEKFKIYNYPLMDTLEFIAAREFKKGKPKAKESLESKVEELIARYNIETMWIGAIRGRTVSNAFVIIDECQNFSPKSLQTVLTRLDKDCKVVLIGSNRQIDHPYINRYTNGLSYLLKEAKISDKSEVNIFATEMNKVVRGKITAWAERVFENKR